MVSGRVACIAASTWSVAFGAARGALLVVIAVGLLSLGPVQQDSWWQESRLVPQFLLVADWSKNLILVEQSVAGQRNQRLIDVRLTDDTDDATHATQPLLNES